MFSYYISCFMKERFRALLFSGIILFACYYSYDIPSALNKRLIANKKDFSTSKITYLYSAYALPNIICPFLVGTYVQLRTARLSYYLCLLIFLGQVIFSLGIGLQSYLLMVVGRLIYGLGGESFIFVQSKKITMHFKNRELAFSMACLVVFGKLGTISTYVLTPLIAERLGSFVSASMGTLFNVLAIAACLASDASRSFKQIEKETETCGSKDDSAEKVISSRGLQKHEEKAQEMRWKKNMLEVVSNSDQELKFGCYLQPEDTAQKSVEFDSTFEIYRKLYSGDRTSLFMEGDTLFIRPLSPHHNMFHSVFYIYLVMVFFFSCVWTPFYNIAPLLFQERYKVTNEESGKNVAIIEVISMFFISLTSIFSDFIGYKLLLVLLGGFLLVFSHILIYFSLGTVHIIVFLLGLASPLISCYWPCMPHLLSEEKMGSGLAIFTCISNFSYTLSPALVSFILSFGHSFDGAELFFIIISGISTSLTALLFCCNRWYGLGMNKPSSRHELVSKKSSS